MAKCIIKLPSSVFLTYLDAVIFLWIVYILCNGWLHGIQVSNRLLEFGGLILLYFFLRQVEYLKYGVILGAIILGATLQSVYGNLQLWGYTPSNHALFKITGSFFNPGPFAGYLAAVFPLITGGILFKKKYILFISVKWNQTFIWVAATFILLALAASGSRAAWLSIVVSSAFLLIKRYSISQCLKSYTLIKRVMLWCSVVLLVFISFMGLIKINPNSANGRLLVWRIASDMVVEHPLLGVGYDRFKTYFMDKQASYFKENIDSATAMLAGDTNYCFNEILQHTVENGVIGLLFLVVILFYLFTISSKLYESELWTGKAGVISILVFATFSYPMQVLPIKICLICYLAYIGVLNERKIRISLNFKRNAFKPIFIVLIIGAFLIKNKISAYNTAWRDWGVAYRLVQTRNFAASISACKESWPLLKNNGDFLTFYGKLLTMAGKHEQAIDILNQAVLFYPNTVVYVALGDSYKVLGDIERSEQAYLKAWYMNPSRFYPKYLLAKLYDETEQVEKAIIIAEELLEKDVKVESTAINEIQAEMRNIIERNKE